MSERNNELHTIHAKYSEIEYALEAFLDVLEVVQEYHDIQYDKEVNKVLEVVNRYIQLVHREICEVTDRFDELLVGNVE